MRWMYLMQLFYHLLKKESMCLPGLGLFSVSFFFNEFIYIFKYVFKSAYDIMMVEPQGMRSHTDNAI